MIISFRDHLARRSHETRRDRDGLVSPFFETRPSRYRPYIILQTCIFCFIYRFSRSQLSTWITLAPTPARSTSPSWSPTRETNSDASSTVTFWTTTMGRNPFTAWCDLKKRTKLFFTQKNQVTFAAEVQPEQRLEGGHQEQPLRRLRHGRTARDVQTPGKTIPER